MKAIRRFKEEQQAKKRRRGILDAASALAALSNSAVQVSPTSVACPSTSSPESTRGRQLTNTASDTRPSAAKPKTSNRSGDFAKTFPEKLMDMLDDEENRDIIRWLPHGKSFVIHDPIKLTSEVMPKYHLRRSKYESFTRKLYFWGFRKISQGKEPDTFLNKLFRKGNFPLCRHIRCPDESNSSTPAVKASLKAMPLSIISTTAERRVTKSEEGAVSDNTETCDTQQAKRQRMMDVNQMPNLAVPPSNSLLGISFSTTSLSNKLGKSLNVEQPSLCSLLRMKLPEPNVEVKGVCWSPGLLEAEFSSINHDMMQSILLHRQRHKSITAAALSNLTKNAANVADDNTMASDILSSVCQRGNS